MARVNGDGGAYYGLHPHDVEVVDASQGLPMAEKPKPDHDPINSPSHYTRYKGLEVIQLTEQMNFNRGNAVKYISRAGHKDSSTEIEDLEKAKWYIQREIERLLGHS